MFPIIKSKRVENVNNKYWFNDRSHLKFLHFCPRQWQRPKTTWLIYRFDFFLINAFCCYLNLWNVDDGSSNDKMYFNVGFYFLCNMWNALVYWWYLWSGWLKLTLIDYWTGKEKSNTSSWKRKWVMTWARLNWKHILFYVGNKNLSH